MGLRAAECLTGMTLIDGWVVKKIITRKPTDTGSCFSVGYEVENSDGVRGFLKAIDLSRAMQSKEPTKELEKLLADYNFEKYVLDRCKNKRMKRVLTPLAHGSIDVPGIPNLDRMVPYFIFDLAQGDIRQVVNASSEIDIAWSVRSLHNAAIGMMQLHQAQIAHQDIKPSNLMVFTNKDSRIGDLGRASDVEKPFRYDSLPIAGDRSYAPPDLLYTDIPITGFQRKLSTDIYHLGSLIFFYFTGTSAIGALEAKLISGGTATSIKKNSFTQDLPYLQAAFDESIADLRTSIAQTAPEIAEDLARAARYLCEPDPARRGDPKWHNSVVSNYDLRTFISRFDILASRLEKGMMC